MDVASSVARRQRLQTQHEELTHMDRNLVGATMIAAPVALAVAAVAAGLSPEYPSWWSAAVHLAILGGIALMIYAVNIRIVPVFARRRWRSPRLLVAQVVAGGAGA